jgi:hypothetical protein
MEENLKKEIELFFNTYGIKPRREIDYKGLFIRLHSKRKEFELLDMAEETKRYLRLDLTEELEENAYEMFKAVTLRVKDKKHLNMYGDKKHFDDFAMKFDDVLTVISQSWELYKTFCDEQKRNELAFKTVGNIFCKYTKEIGRALKFELPELVMEQIK